MKLFIVSAVLWKLNTTQSMFFSLRNRNTCSWRQSGTTCSKSIDREENNDRGQSKVERSSKPILHQLRYSHYGRVPSNFLFKFPYKVTLPYYWLWPNNLRAWDGSNKSAMNTKTLANERLWKLFWKLSHLKAYLVLKAHFWYRITILWHFAKFFCEKTQVLVTVMRSNVNLQCRVSGSSVLSWAACL